MQDSHLHNYNMQERDILRTKNYRKNLLPTIIFYWLLIMKIYNKYNLKSCEMGLLWDIRIKEKVRFAFFLYQSL